jgi:hypothetical protein
MMRSKLKKIGLRLNGFYTTPDAIVGHDGMHRLRTIH